MGSIQDIKRAFEELAEPDRKKLLNELQESMSKHTREKPVYVPTQKQREAGITAELVAKHPLLQFAGMWSDEEADQIAAAIKEADWIDEEDEGCFG